MKHSLTEKPAMQLVGIAVRTNNACEVDKMKGKIFPCIQRYFHGGLSEKISNRMHPGTTICAYTDYESDHTGDYTYFIGEEVSSIDCVPEGFQTLYIEKQDYAKFTTGPAPMPDVIVGAWQKIWNMTPDELGGKRAYQTDFEVYDERASDHQNIVADIFIGLKLPF